MEKNKKIKKIMFCIISILSITFSLLIRKNILFCNIGHIAILEKVFLILGILFLSLPFIVDDNHFSKYSAKIMVIISVYLIHSLILDLILIVDKIFLRDMMMVLSIGIFFETLYYFNKILRVEYLRKINLFSILLLIPLYFIYDMLIQSFIILRRIYL
ncbi:MAG: hypothetical protein PHV06_02655 [bacterium]|nr:hypothetical protein [bacterium]